MFISKFHHILNLFEISVIHSTTENALHGNIAISVRPRFCKLDRDKNWAKFATKYAKQN